MDREHVKGAADKAKGAIKDTAGKLMDDKELQTEGKLDKAKGAAHNVAGDVKDAFRKPPSSTHKPNFEKSRLRAALFVFAKLCEISRRETLLPA